MAEKTRIYLFLTKVNCSGDTFQVENPNDSRYGKNIAVAGLFCSGLNPQSFDWVNDDFLDKSETELEAAWRH